MQNGSGPRVECQRNIVTIRRVPAVTKVGRTEPMAALNPAPRRNNDISRLENHFVSS